MRTTRWLKLAGVTLVLATALHVLVVWLVPIVIMKVVMGRVVQQAGVNRVIAQPLPTDKSRSIVTPSPDLLYGLCVFDVSDGPVRVSMSPPSTYWSLALFDTNTDNVFKLNAADLKGPAADLVLGSAGQASAAKAKFPTAVFFETPHVRGVMLARILVLDRMDMAAALAAQQSVRCDPINSQG